MLFWSENTELQSQLKALVNGEPRIISELIEFALGLHFVNTRNQGLTNHGKQSSVFLLTLWHFLAHIMYGTHLMLSVDSVNCGENDDGK